MITNEFFINTLSKHSLIKRAIEKPTKQSIYIQELNVNFRKAINPNDSLIIRNLCFFSFFKKLKIDKIIMNPLNLNLLSFNNGNFQSLYILGYSLRFGANL